MLWTNPQILCIWCHIHNIYFSKSFEFGIEFAWHHMFVFILFAGTRNLCVRLDKAQCNDLKQLKRKSSRRSWFIYQSVPVKTCSVPQ